jgi:hypothetical protein
MSTSSFVSVKIRQVNDAPTVSVSLLSSSTGLTTKVLTSFDTNKTSVSNTSNLLESKEDNDEEDDNDYISLDWIGDIPSPLFLRVIISDPDARESVSTGMHGEAIYSPLNITVSFSLLNSNQSSLGQSVESVQSISLGLSHQQGLTFLGNSSPTGAERLSFLADLNKANAALSSLEIKRHSASGKISSLSGFLTIEVNDRGFTGEGGAKHVLFRIKVYMKAWYE